MIITGYLDHPACPRVLATVREPNPALVMEEFRGKPLEVCYREEAPSLRRSSDCLTVRLTACPPVRLSDGQMLTPARRALAPPLWLPDCLNACLTVRLSDGQGEAGKRADRVLGPAGSLGKAVSRAYVLRAANSVISGLRYLHANGICHGDIHAHSVLVDTQVELGILHIKPFVRPFATCSETLHSIPGNINTDALNNINIDDTQLR
eukprot:240905-Prorocentrum_minimum.AAC.1